MKLRHWRIVGYVGSAIVAGSLVLSAQAAGIAGLPDPQVPNLQPPPSLPKTPQLPSAPQAPKVPSLPKVETPSAPSVETPSTPAGVPNTDQATGAVGGATGGGASRSQRALGPSGTGAPTAGNSDPSAVAGQGASATGLHSSAGARRAAERAAQAVVHFRRSVKHLQGCLYAVSGLESRVLRLRTGIGGGKVLSRPTVARRLKVSTGRVRRAEHSGLKRLRAADRSDGCGRVNLGVQADDGARTVVAAAQSGPTLQPVAGLGNTATADTSAGSRSPRSGVLGAHASSDQGQAPAKKRESKLAGAVGESPGGGNGPLIATIAAALVLLAGLLLLLLRRRTHDAYGSDYPYPPAGVDWQAWELPPPPPPSPPAAEEPAQLSPWADEPSEGQALDRVPPRTNGNHGRARAVFLGLSGIVSLVAGRVLERRLRRRR